MADVSVSSHPLLRHKLARLRHRETSPPAFRELVYEITQVLFYESTREVPLRQVTVPTPLADCPGEEIAASIGLVPVLRAGLGMASAMLDALPEAQVWHVGLYRDEQTLLPVEYYNKLPNPSGLDWAFVLDPMLATGGSAIATIDILKRVKAKRIVFLGLIAAPEGVAKLSTAHPDVPIYLAAIDVKLNEVGYIVPGLGDAGDRQFGTA
ncbi:MAG: uracil phosphoribosyltransferase [Gemmataceae bacterium]